MLLTRRSKPGNYLNNETKKLSNQLNNSTTCYCVTRAREWLFCDVISAVLLDALFIFVERDGGWGRGCSSLGSLFAVATSRH